MMDLLKALLGNGPLTRSNTPRNNSVKVFTLCPRTDRWYETSAVTSHNSESRLRDTCFLQCVSVPHLYSESGRWDASSRGDQFSTVQYRDWRIRSGELGRYSKMIGEEMTRLHSDLK
jgi:hypothetical protein